MSILRKRWIQYLVIGAALTLLLAGGAVLYFRTMDLLRVSGMKDEIRHLLVTVQELYRTGNSSRGFDELASTGCVDSAVVSLMRTHRLIYVPFDASTPDTALVLSGKIHGIALRYTKGELALPKGDRSGPAPSH